MLGSARACWASLRVGADAWAYHALASGVCLFHLAEVNLLDAPIGTWARAATGWSYRAFAPVEAPLMRALDTVHPRGLVAFATIYYLAGFIALLVLTPALLAAVGDRVAMRRALVAYPILYAIALPFYLFWPAENPYVALHLAGPFGALDPRLEGIYYWFTTRDNTFPSLHVAFTIVLVATAARAPGLRSIRGWLWLHAGLLLTSVVYLRVHWVGDVVGGGLAAAATLALARACVPEPHAPRGWLARVGDALDRASLLGHETRRVLFVEMEPRGGETPKRRLQGPRTR